MMGLVGSGFGCRQNAGSGSSGGGRSTALDPQTRDTHGQPSNVEQGNPLGNPQGNPPGSHRGENGPVAGTPAAGDNPGAQGETADRPAPTNAAKRPNPKTHDKNSNPGSGQGQQ